MKMYPEIEQGSAEWHSLRAGIPTSSEFGNIITPATGKESASLTKYAEWKAAEIYLKEAIQDDYISKAMDMGKVLEIQAADQYELIFGMDVERVGFITDDLGHYGCSPDRVVGDDGLLEIKCINLKDHAHYMFNEEIDPKHKPQIQGQLLVSERDWVDYWVYNPRLPPVRVRNYRDEEFIEKLETHLKKFREVLAEKVDWLIQNEHILPDENGELPINITDAG